MGIDVATVIALLALSLVDLTPRGSVHFSSMCEGLEVEGDLIYAATTWGLEVYRAEGEGLVKAGELPTSKEAVDVAVRGGLHRQG